MHDWVMRRSIVYCFSQKTLLLVQDYEFARGELWHSKGVHLVHLLANVMMQMRCHQNGTATAHAVPCENKLVIVVYE